MRVLRPILVAALALGLVAGCASDQEEGPYGTLELAMEGDEDDDEKWFRVRLFDGALEDSEVLFDSSCMGVELQGFRISFLEPGPDRSVLVEYFTGAECRDDARGSVGFRGGIEVVEDGEEAPFYYVQRYRDDAMTALPEDLNVSGGAAVKLSDDCETDCLCEVDADCEAHVEFGPYCFVADGGDHWCVPTCTTDGQCSQLHPDAVCNQSEEPGRQYCMLYTPFPLNMSEPRAFGHATSTSSGDVVLVGGFGAVEFDALRHVQTPIEIFDSRTGLFRHPAGTVVEAARGLGGFAKLDADRFALVGGVRSVRPVWKGQGSDLSLTFEGLGGEDCTSGACHENMSDRIVVVDTAAETAEVSGLPGPRALSTQIVLPSGQLLILGGYMASGISDGAVRSNAVFRCDIGSDLRATCTGFGSMATERAGAAATCLDAGCNQVLVLGGNTGGELAEVLTVSEVGVDTTTLGNPSLPGKVFGPALCGTDLVGGGDGLSDVGGILPVALSVNSGQLAVQALANVAGTQAPVFPTVVDTGDGCWVTGGISGAGTVSKDLHFVSSDTFGAEPTTLTRQRFAAAGAVIEGGPIAGAVLFAGGLDLTVTGAGVAAEVVRGAEVLRP